MPLEIVTKYNNIDKVNPRLRQGAANALNKGIMTAISYADPLTPVDTGLLKGNKAIITASPGSLTAAVGWVQEYAIYQEMGTSRGVKAKHFAKTGSERAQPALQAAMTAVGGTLA